MTIQLSYILAMGEDVLTALAITVAILIGALPVAMHVVCMTIMAIGAYRLSSHGAVVSELTAVEELSGMDFLCSDKTGTLTYNRLEIIKDKCEVYGDFTVEDLYFIACLASKRVEKGQDAIDYCITNALKTEFPAKNTAADGYVRRFLDGFLVIYRGRNWLLGIKLSRR